MEIAYLTAKMKLKSGASKDSLSRVQAHFGLNFPSDYLNFLLRTNGGEGLIGSEYLILWSIDDLITLNDAYSVDKFAPGLILIGSDGGDTAYAIDTRTSDLCFIEVPFIGMDLQEVKTCGKKFLDFLEFLFQKNRDHLPPLFTWQ
jgi:hypothetical protein